MPAISTADLKNGMTLELDNGLFNVVEFQHVKPGKGGAFVRTKLKNLKTGRVIDETWNSGEKIVDVRLEPHSAQYLYASGEDLHFMNTESFDQFTISKETIGDSASYLKDGLVLQLLMRGSEIITIEFPKMVELAAKTGRILTLEDHHVDTGLGRLVAVTMAEQGLHAKLRRLGVTRYSSSGAPNDLFAQMGLDAAGVTRAAKELL